MGINDGVGGVTIGLGKNPPGKVVAMIHVSAGGQVQITAPEMQGHLELLAMIGQIAHAVVHVHPNSDEGKKLTQSLRVTTHMTRSALQRQD